MVQKRLGRTHVNSGDLTQFRIRLHRCILRYTAAVLTMIDEDEPASLSVVMEALRPFTIVRKKRKRMRAEEGYEDGEVALEDELSVPVEGSEEPEAVMGELPTG